MSCTFAPSLRLKWQQEKKNTSADSWVLTVLLLSLIGKPQVFEEAVKKMWAAGRIMLRELILDINQKMILLKSAILKHRSWWKWWQPVVTQSWQQCRSKTDEHFNTVYAGVITDVSGHLVASQCLWIISEAADMELCPCASQLGGCPTCAY